jgi:predicted membrane channel-forming protein YqfA (hemolysin III family)
VNVWTEFAPAVGFTVWLVLFLRRHESLSPTDRSIAGAGLACATVIRPFCSGLAHLLHCVSARGYILWWTIDYCSICVAILATSLVAGRFAFFCSEPLQVLFFTSAVGLLCTSIVAVLSVSSPALRNVSFLLFVLFCNGVPFVYTLAAKLSSTSTGVGKVPWDYLALWAASLGTFALGLTVKGTMLPERAAKGAWWADLLLPSHALWHIVLNVGFALGTFLAWDVYLTWREQPGSECPTPA